MRNSKPIFKLYIAQKLIEQGFRVVRIEHHYKFKTQLVFFFEDTPELKTALASILK